MFPSPRKKKKESVTGPLAVLREKPGADQNQGLVRTATKQGSKGEGQFKDDPLLQEGI